MKLLVRKRKLGWTTVRAGRVRRVAVAHAVPTSGMDHKQTAEHDGSQWVYAQPGDLAVEIVTLKTGAVIGDCYVTGPAVRLNRYTPEGAGWFAPGAVVVNKLVLDRYEGQGSSEEWFRSLNRDLHVAAIAEQPSVFVVVDRSTPAGQILEVLGRADALVHVDAEEVPRTQHTFGLVFGAGADGHGKSAALFHCEPKGNKTETGASTFGISLLADAAGWDLP